MLTSSTNSVHMHASPPIRLDVFFDPYSSKETVNRVMYDIYFDTRTGIRIGRHIQTYKRIHARGQFDRRT